MIWMGVGLLLLAVLSAAFGNKMIMTRDPSGFYFGFVFFATAIVTGLCIPAGFALLAMGLWPR